MENSLFNIACFGYVQGGQNQWRLRSRALSNKEKIYIFIFASHLPETLKYI